MMPHGGTSGHLAPMGHLALPPGHTSLGPGRTGQRENGHWDTGTPDFEHLVRGCARFQGLCVRGSPTYFTVPSFRLPFSKTTFLRYFIYYKICQVEVVSSVFTKLCSHHHKSNFRMSQQPQKKPRTGSITPSPFIPTAPGNPNLLFSLRIHQLWEVHINGIIP